MSSESEDVGRSTVKLPGRAGKTDRGEATRRSQKSQDRMVSWKADEIFQ